MDAQQVARTISESVAQLFFSAENQARFHGASEDLGLPPPTLKALLDLDVDRGTPMRDLAEQWGCDASFVTVTCDGLEAAGLIERRVAEHDRRVKLIELTPAGVEAQAEAVRQVHGPRAGMADLTPDELSTLAELLAKLAAAQAEHDDAFLDEPGVRPHARRGGPHRQRDHRAPPGRGGDRGTWRDQFEAHRAEIASLKEEMARVRDEIKAQARRPVDEAKAAKNAAKQAAKAQARRPIDEAKAAKRAAKEAAKQAARDAVEAHVEGTRDEAVAHLKGGRRRR